MELWSICEAGWQVAVSEYVGRKEGGREGRLTGRVRHISAILANLAARVYTPGGANFNSIVESPARYWERRRH